MRGIRKTAWKATIATVGIAVASVAFASPALATVPAPATATRPAGSTWTAFPEGRLLVDNGRDLSQVAGGRLRTLVAGSTFQRKYGSFTKNGTKIVYSDVGRRGFGAQLWVMDATGGGRHQITALTAEAFGAKFSPDGSKIAFQTAAGGAAAIWLVGVDGARPHQISKPGSSSYYGPGLSWAPDGQKLVATRAQVDENSGEPYHWQLVTIRADGANETALTSAGGDKNSPVWSPSGRTIVFSYITPAGMQAGTQYDLYSMNANGTGLHRLTDTPNVGEQDAVFSPSSTAIAYASWRPEETAPQVMKAKADGTVTKAVNATGYPTGWER